jgi:hypothetical protein
MNTKISSGRHIQVLAGGLLSAMVVTSALYSPLFLNGNNFKSSAEHEFRLIRIGMSKAQTEEVLRHAHLRCAYRADNVCGLVDFRREYYIHFDRRSVVAGKGMSDSLHKWLWFIPKVRFFTWTLLAPILGR